MNTIKNTISHIRQIALVLTFVFVALMVVQPNSAAAATPAPNTRRVTAMARPNAIRRNVLIKINVSNVEPRNVVSSATEPIVPSEPANVVLPATEPAHPRNVVSTATEPVTPNGKTTTPASGPRIEVIGARITR